MLRPVNATTFDQLAIRLSRRATRRKTLGTMAAIASFLCAEPGQPIRAQTGPFAGISLGGACIDAAECAQIQACNVPGPVMCADNGLVDDGRLTCCLSEGGFCLDAAHCCAGLDCVGDAVHGCDAGTCQPSAWASRSAACDAHVASILAQLPVRSAYAILSTWGQSTPELFALPAHCPWPALPPESPWCTPEACVDNIRLEHADDGLTYCYWYDPDLAGDLQDPSDGSGRRAKWRCGSLDQIASTQ
jgi:hypothetical protein